MKRLFFGLMPDDFERQRCLSVMQTIQHEGTQTVAAANLHVTVLFLGMVDSVQETALIEQTEGIPIPKMTLVFNQLSYWPKPSVLCLTSQSVPLELLQLINALTAMAKNVAIKLDERPYQPHVTLAKKAKQPITLDIEPLVWSADSLCLLESCSSGQGVEYRILKRWLQ